MVQISNTKARKYLFYSPLTKNKGHHPVSFVFCYGDTRPSPAVNGGGGSGLGARPPPGADAGSATRAEKRSIGSAPRERARYDYFDDRAFQIPPPQPKTKKQSNGLFFLFLERCVSLARNVMCSTCVMTASLCDVRFARE